jgi:hypothetical protein
VISHHGSSATNGLWEAQEVPRALSARNPVRSCREIPTALIDPVALSTCAIVCDSCHDEKHVPRPAQGAFVPTARTRVARRSAVETTSEAVKLFAMTGKAA